MIHPIVGTIKGTQTGAKMKVLSFFNSGTDVAILLVGKDSCKDNAQILSVTVKQCAETGKTPREICNAVVGEMKSLLDDLVQPVKSFPEQLEMMRTHAKRCKSGILNALKA